MSANDAVMSATIDEMTESMAILDARVSAVEDHLGRMTAGKPLPFRGGVGVGYVRDYDACDTLTDPSPGPSPEGEGRS